MIIHMISEHASPLAVLGGADAGGQNVHVAALATALAGRGHEVTVFTRRDDAALPTRVPLRSGVVVEHVDAGPASPVPKDALLPFMPEFAAALERSWRMEAPDVAHAHFWMSGWAALTAASDLGVPVVQTFHALGSVKRRHQGSADASPGERRVLEPRVARAAQRIVATCTDEVRELGTYGARPDRVSVVPCGVDLRLFRPEGRIAPRTPRPRVLAVGRLVRRKGLDTVLEALASLPEAELLVVGGAPGASPQDDPDLSERLAAAAGHGVADRVAFLGGVAHEEVPALMRSADVVVSVPWYEPFGMVPVETMACGRPMIASAVGGHLDTIVDGVTGLLVPPRDPGALTAALHQVLDRPRLRDAMGRAGAERARSHYSWERVAAETENAYTRAAGRRPALANREPKS